jgi:hypothetical protein
MLSRILLRASASLIILKGTCGPLAPLSGAFGASVRVAFGWEATSFPYRFQMPSDHP